MTAKDSLVQDLRSKLQTLEEALERGDMEILGTHGAPHRVEPFVAGGTVDISATSSPPAAPSGSMVDITKMTVAELRSRVKASELERNRFRNRLNVLKDKLTDMENENRRLQEENKQAKDLAARLETAKGNIARKEQGLRVAKNQCDELRVELEEQKKYAEAKYLDMERKTK